MAPAAAISPRKRLQQPQPPPSGPAEDAPLEVISLNSPSTASEGSSSSGGSGAGAKKGERGSGSSRRAMLPPFQLDKGRGKGKGMPAASPSGAGEDEEEAEGGKKGGGGAKARALVRTKKLVRALGFFYHLSLAVLFTTFTELLLGDFGGNFSKTAAFLGTCAGVERGVQFFTSPFLGNLSDSVGRRPVLLGSLSLHLASLLLVTLLPNRNSVLCYFIVNGACNVTLGMMNAMVADLCSAQGKVGEGQLAQQYGKLGMAIGLSMIIGPAVGPSLQKMDVHYPLYLSILFLGVSLVLGVVMSESMDPRHKTAFSWAKSNPFHALRAALKYRRFLLFSGPFCLSQLAECVYQFVVLYTQRRFGWGYVMLGFYVSATGIFLALVQGNLRFIVPRFVSQNGCVTVGLLGHAIGMSVMGLAAQGWMMALAVPPQMIASLKGPGLMSVLSDKVAPEEQGVLQGSVMSLRVLSKAVGGPIFGAVLAFAMSDKAQTDLGGWVIGLPFLVAGACDFVGSFLAWLIFKFSAEMNGSAAAATGASDGPTAALVSSARKSKADVEMEEGGKALGGPAAGSISRTNTLGTFDDTATASSMDNGTDGTSSVAGSSVDDAGEAFEKRSHVLFPGQYAEFDGLDPLSI